VALVRVVRVAVDQVIDVLAGVVHRGVAAVRAMVVVWLAAMDLVQFGGVKDSCGH